MSFLAPWYLLGCAAIVLPLAFHFWMRHLRGAVPFSSLMFLQPSPPQQTTRRKVNDWLLLCLRCLACLLLVATFMRPFVAQFSMDNSGETPYRRVIVAVDVTASMQREDLWQQAVDSTLQAVAQREEVDELSIWMWSGTIDVLLPADHWRELTHRERSSEVRRLLRHCEPNRGGARLPKLLEEALITLRQPSPVRSRTVAGELVIISDFQRGLVVEDEAKTGDVRWPEDLAVSLLAVQPRKTGNVGLRLVDSRDENNAVVRVSNSRDGQPDTVTVTGETVLSATAFEETLQVPAGSFRSISIPKVIDNQPVVRVRLKGDSHGFDNVFTLPEQQIRRQKVVYFGEDDPNDSQGLCYFLARALPNRPDRIVELITPVKPMSNDARPFAAESVPLCVVSRKLTSPEVSWLQQALSRGGRVLVVLQTADEIECVRQLTGNREWRASEAIVDQYDLLGEVDFNHPMFSPFQGVEYANFTGIAIWRRRSVTLPTGHTEALQLREATSGAFGRSMHPAVPLRFANGDPALIDVPVDAGRVYVLAFGWHGRDSQLARSTKFSPLVEAMLETSGRAPSESTPLIGPEESIPLPAETEHLEGRLVGPGGEQTVIPAGLTRIAAGTQPGQYRWQRGESSGAFVVRLPLTESLTAPLGVTELRQWGLPAWTAEGLVDATAESSATSNSTKADTSSTERGQHLIEQDRAAGCWRFFLLAAIVVLLAETVYANRRSTINVDEATVTEGPETSTNEVAA